MIRRNRASSMASRLTVTRSRPAARRVSALPASRAALVVSVMSPMPATSASIPISRSSLARTRGSPPVTRTLVTPWSAKTRVSRAISSKVRISSRGRKAWSEPNSSLGMQ